MLTVFSFLVDIFQLHLFVTPIMSVSEYENSWLVEENGIYRHLAHAEVTTEGPQGGKTLHELFVQSVKTRPDDDFLGTINKTENTVKYNTYSEVYHKVRQLSNFLEKILRRPKMIVGIFAGNSEPWFVSEQAIISTGGVSCPLYATLGADALKHIVKETRMEIIFIEGDKASILIDFILDSKDSNIKKIISFQDIESQYLEKIKARDIEVMYYSEILETSQVTRLTNVELQVHLPSQLDSNPHKNQLIDFSDDFSKEENEELDDVISICYTSGTSGYPKGAMLTNSNFLALITGFSMGPNGKPILNVDSSIVYFSYLPLAHVMEKICFYVVITVGGKIGIFSGIRERLSKDMAIIKPLMLPGVPRVFNKIKEGILDEIKSKGCVINLLFHIALKYKIWRLKHLRPGQYYSSTLLDGLIFDKIKEKFGGKFIFGISGSAPLDPKVSQFFSAVFSFKIYEGYGQTEALGANLLQTPFECSLGSVGVPFPSISIKFVTTEEGENEICMKGQAIFKGYFKNKKETDKVLRDGWLHTGDTGEVKNGEFYINGRIGENFKLSFGEFICPSKLEDKLKIPGIDEVLVAGRSDLSFIIALAFTTDMDADETALTEKFMKNATDIFKNKEIMRFEIPKKLVIIKNPEPLSTENNMLTPTGKKRRKYIMGKHKELIESNFRN